MTACAVGHALSLSATRVRTCSSDAVRLPTFDSKVRAPSVRVLIADCRLVHDAAAGDGAAAGALTTRLSTTFRVDQMRFASVSMELLCSGDAAVPVRVMVSPPTVRA